MKLKSTVIFRPGDLGAFAGIAADAAQLPKFNPLATAAPVNAFFAMDNIARGGPVGFQGYNIKAEPRDVLTRSIAAWRRFTAQ